MILGKKGSKKWSKKWSKSGIFWKIPGSNIPGERGGVKNEHVLSRFFKTVKKRQLLRPNFFTVFQFFSVQKWPFLGHFAQVATWGFWSKNGHFWTKKSGPKMPRRTLRFFKTAHFVHFWGTPKMTIFGVIFWPIFGPFFGPLLIHFLNTNWQKHRAFNCNFGRWPVQKWGQKWPIFGPLFGQKMGHFWPPKNTNFDFFGQKMTFFGGTPIFGGPQKVEKPDFFDIFVK